MSRDNNPALKTVYWAFKLLECFDQEHGMRGVTELAALTGIPKSSVCNALATFEQLGYVRKHSITGKYALAPKVACLYHAYCAANSDMILFQREIQAISERTNTIAHIAALVDDSLITLASAYPSRFSQPQDIGSELPFHCTALGKAILAFMKPERKQRVLQKGLQAFTDYTVTDPALLEAELAVVRQRDCAVSKMEYEYGMCSVAVPLHFSKKTEGLPPTKYAIGVSVPCEKITDEQMYDYVKIIRDTHREYLQPLLDSFRTY